MDWKFRWCWCSPRFVSFAPMTLLSIKMNGDWAGDAGDQWDVKTHNPLGGLGGE